MKSVKQINAFMKTALDFAFRGMESGQGGPFGAVIVQNNAIIAAAHNKVLATNDPTMHAEIAAIREATQKLGRFDLSDCEIYSTCQPCPMCLGAIFWAKIPKLYYGCDENDAADIGFDDRFIYEAIRGGLYNQDKLKIKMIDREACLKAFEAWENKQDKRRY
ncbi:MAG: nucleoside deaminase [Oscillospiraceae bacterium]|jgi:guanine deaminase|nr:nucleoside deaminase [Oscillospiraceae bacterium]